MSLLTLIQEDPELVGQLFIAIGLAFLLAPALIALTLPGLADAMPPWPAMGLGASGIILGALIVIGECKRANRRAR